MDERTQLGALIRQASSVKMSKGAHFSNILIALLAGVFYGAWAVYANFEHGAHAYVMAGAVQALYAFASTLCISHVARAVFLKCECGLKGISLGFLISFIVMLLIPVTVHKIAGTPDILETILPGLVLGTFYLLGYLISLDMRLRVLPARDDNPNEDKNEER